MAFAVVFASVAIHVDHEYSDVPTYAETLMATGNCWTGGEGHPYPTEAIVADEAGNASLITAQSAVDKILVNQMAGKETGLIAFCE